jgi:outer membrane cobalamin receptor
LTENGQTVITGRFSDESIFTRIASGKTLARTAVIFNRFQQEYSFKMKSFKKRLIGTFSLLLLHGLFANLSAQTPENLLDMSLDDLLNVQVTVSSTKGENIFSATSTVSVIDAEMIKQYNFRSISEALQTVSGFSVSRTYLKRNLPTARGILQDHYANKVLVLINNVPTWNAVTGESGLDRISINDVQRIEVLKGPASVLYGTNAYSGAVNIVLKENEIKGIRFGIGEHASYDAGGFYNAKHAKGAIFVSSNISSSTGKEFVFTDEAAVTGHYNEFEKTNNFTFKGNYGGHNLFFNGFAYDESFLGVTPLFTQGAGRSQTSKGYLANYTYNTHLSEKITAKSGIIFDWNQRDFPRTIDDSVRANVEGTRVLGFV